MSVQTAIRMAALCQELAEVATCDHRRAMWCRQAIYWAERARAL